jgi:broad specificity phosphatase PhoE
VVTVLAVRHADIDLPPGSADPDLNAAGRVRAESLAHVVEKSGVSTIFTSEFARTKQTVEPSARELGLVPRLAPAAATLAREALAGRFGEVLLIAGHSNTVPMILAALGASSPPVIGEREFDNLFVLTTSSGNDGRLVHLRYGAGGGTAPG